MTIIGLIGYAQAGKTTAAEALTQATQVNFADPLRDLARHINPTLSAEGWTSRRWRETEDTAGYEWLKENTDGRDFLVKLGDGARQLVDPEVWVTAWMRKATSVIEDGAAAVVAADVRYPNEAFAIRRMGGFTILIDRPLNKPANDVEKVTIAQIVAKGLVTNRIENSGSPEDLRQQVAGLFPTLVG